jgi:hypothetical protein
MKLKRGDVVEVRVQGGGRCLKCGGPHLLLQCSQYQEELMKPSAGVCGRCGGAATFYPSRVLVGGSYRILAQLICHCCSYAACQHRCPSR